MCPDLDKCSECVSGFSHSERVILFGWADIKLLKVLWTYSTLEDGMYCDSEPDTTLEC